MVTVGDHYRTRAAELRAQALHESNPRLQGEFESLAASYLRLAEQADQNDQLNVAYETPPPKEIEPGA